MVVIMLHFLLGRRTEHLETMPYLAFGTRVNAGSTTEKIRIDSDGRVFINHTSDTAPAGYQSKLQLCDSGYNGSSIH